MSTISVTCIRCGAEMHEPGLQCEKCRCGASIHDRERLSVIPSVTGFPGRVHLELPWSALASDNLRKGLAGQANREKSAEYREALARARSKLREQYTGDVFDGPVILHAKFWVPDDRRRDLSNFAKLILDSLVGIVISDDRWQVLRRQTWEGCGIDVDRPLCEIEVRKL